MQFHCDIVGIPNYITNVLDPLRVWDVKFAIQIGSDWPQMGQIWDFLRSVSVHFGAPAERSLNGREV